MNGLNLTVPAGREVTSVWDVHAAVAVTLVLVNEGQHVCTITWGHGEIVQTLAPDEWVSQPVADAVDEVSVGVKSEKGTQILIGSPAHDPATPHADPDLMLTPLGEVLAMPGSLMAWVPKPLSCWTTEEGR